MKYCCYKKKIREENKSYCADCSLKLFRTGENHYLWNQNITKEEREFGRRTIPGYIEFLKSVLARDNYTCQCCGEHNCKLDVHHLDGYDWCKEKRCDITNGVTLCKTCHKNFHSIYGRGKNTKKQYEKWIGMAIENINDYNGKLPTAREVYCIEEDKIYSSSKCFCDAHGMKSFSAVNKTCNNAKLLATSSEEEVISSTITNIPKKIKGMHVLWYNDYKQMSKEEIERFLKKSEYKRRRIPIICIDTLEVFSSISLCSKMCKIHNDYIKNCCSNLVSYKRRDGKNFRFMYYEDYLKKNNLTDEEAHINGLYTYIN